MPNSVARDIEVVARHEQLVVRLRREHRNGSRVALMRSDLDRVESAPAGASVRGLAHDPGGGSTVGKVTHDVDLFAQARGNTVCVGPVHDAVREAVIVYLGP